MNDQPSGPPPAVPKSGGNLGLTSLVLGVLSLVPCSIFTGIPAVITGHIALSRAKATGQTESRGQAIAGLVMGYISIGMLVFVVPILAALALPAFAKAKSRAGEVACINNVKQICLAARIYADSHDNKWPADLLSMSNELNSPMVLVCPADSSRSKVGGWGNFDPANISYRLLTPNLDQSKSSQSVPAITCSRHPNITGYSDGSVQRGSRNNTAGF